MDPQPPTTGDTRAFESVVYQAAVDQLRARGCRCVLRFDGVTAVPLNAVDAARCCIDHVWDRQMAQPGAPPTSV